MSAPEEPARPLGYWAIAGEVLLDMLRRVERGEDPDLVYAEAYVNSTIETWGVSNND